MLSIMRRLKSDKRAATAIEYSLIVFLIATATIAAMGNVGQKVLNMLGPAANALT
jgi:Flp pilus assembly pilin Flp